MTETARPLGKQSQAVAEATRRTMLTAALQEFSKVGFAAMSLRHTADAAGVSHALFRKYFGTKEELWRATVDFALERYAAALQAHMSNKTKAAETIRDQIRIVIEVTAEEPALVRIMILEGLGNEERAQYLSEIWHRLGADYANLFHDVKREGDLRPFIYSDLFLFVLTAGMLPVALPRLSNAILNADIADPAQREAHVRRMQDVLFPALSPT